MFIAILFRRNIFLKGDYMSSKYNYSALTSKMKASKIRELMKYASMPGVISFGGGSPDPENFPFEDVKNIIGKWDKKSQITAMQYGTTGGYTELVNDIKKRMTDLKKMSCEGQDIIVTTGGQQGIFLISRIFLDPGDIVLVEEPSFIGGMASFLSCQAELVGINIENDGANIIELEKKLLELRKQGKNVKFFYTIPNFQNPKGTTMSQSKRKALYELSKKHNLLILEDDPYGDLYYTGNTENYLPIKSYGNDAPIIYIGSFSKVMCPGFRLGWVFADKEIIDKAGIAKQSIDACSSSFGQVIASDYLRLGKIDDYLHKMRGIYKSKKELMIKMLKETMPKGVSYTNPDGGFFIYLDLPEGVSGEKLFNETIKENIAFVTGEPFHTNAKEGDKHIRISFSNSSEEEITKGIKVIGEKITLLMKK